MQDQENKMIFVKFYEVVIEKSIEDYNLNLDKSD